MRESVIEKYLKIQVCKAGGLCYKFTSPGTVGVPDRVVVMDGEVYFVEMKNKHGVLSATQGYQIRKLRAHGAKVYVLWSKEMVDQFIVNISKQGFIEYADV